MKNFKLIFASVSLLALSYTASAIDTAPESQIVATYDNIKVTDANVKEEFKDQLEAQKQTYEGLPKSEKEKLVKLYINSKLLDKEVATSGLEKTPEFIAKQEKIKKEILRNELLKNYLKQNVTEAKFEEAYKEYVANTTGKEQYKISHIIVKTEEEAKKVKAEYNSKTNNFSALAKKYSEDKNSLLALDEFKKSSPGLLGYFINGQLPPEFNNKVFSMKTREVSDPIQSKLGWHIFKVDLIRKAKIFSKEDVRNEMMAQLNNQAIQSFIDQLNSKAKIDITVK